MFDFIPGGELFQHLKTAEYFDEARARFYAAEVLLALEFLHGRHIIYRDLKPENILLDAEGHVKLTDFGLAKQLHADADQTQATTFCGTDEYLAPEIVLNEPYDESVDLWALGILLFEMLTGWAPWRDENRHTLFTMIVREPLDLSHPNLSPKAQDLLSKMLVKRREKRLKLADVKKHPFFACVNFSSLLKRTVIPPFKPTLVSRVPAACRPRQPTSRTSMRISPKPIPWPIVRPPRCPHRSRRKVRVSLTCLESLFPGFTFDPSEPNTQQATLEDSKGN